MGAYGVLLDLLTVVVLAFFGTRLVQSFRHALQPAARAGTMALVRGLRLRHFAPVPFLLAGVIGAAALLVEVPGLDFGWWTAIGGQGNPAFGLTDRTVGTPVATVVPMLFVVLLVPALPLLVALEEQVFRAGAEDWSNAKRLARAVLFGLAHAVIGIPVGVALALSIGGLWFTRAYMAGTGRGGGGPPCGRAPASTWPTTPCRGGGAPRARRRCPPRRRRRGLRRRWWEDGRDGSGPPPSSRRPS